MSPAALSSSRAWRVNWKIPASIKRGASAGRGEVRMRRDRVTRRRLDVSELGLEAVRAVWIDVQIA